MKFILSLFWQIETVWESSFWLLNTFRLLVHGNYQISGCVCVLKCSKTTSQPLIQFSKANYNKKPVRAAWFYHRYQHSAVLPRSVHFTRKMQSYVPASTYMSILKNVTLGTIPNEPVLKIYQVFRVIRGDPFSFRNGHKKLKKVYFHFFVE